MGFVQVKGISQGSLLSSMLCNMYLGAVENGHAGNWHITQGGARQSESLLPVKLVYIYMDGCGLSSP